MTVICWDGHTLAADSALTVAGVRLSCEKLQRFPDGSLYGAAGDGDDPARLAKYLKAGSIGRKPRCISVQALHILPDGKVDLYNGSTEPERLTSPYAALGADNKYAMAILWNGGDAIRACEAAIALGRHCTAPVTSLRLIERARAAD